MNRFLGLDLSVRGKKEGVDTFGQKTGGLRSEGKKIRLGNPKENIRS